MMTGMTKGQSLNMMDYNNLFSGTIKEIKPSGIRKFFDAIGDIDGVISLGVGQPDFPTPWHIRRAGIESLKQGKTFYTSNIGLPELRGEVCKYLNRRFGLEYEKNEVVVTVGGSEAIDLAMRTFLSAGDEVIIPQPSFVCYEPIAKFCGAAPVFIATKEKNKFKLTPEELETAITPKTKMLVLPFPNNPTGAIMERDELEAIAAVLRKHNIIVLSDEIYGELTYGKNHVSIASLEGMKERTVLVNGFSKAYSMTGWRLGYACAPAPIIKMMNKAHQFAIMCAPSTSQFAAIEALSNGDEDIEYMKGEYDLRRKYVLARFEQMGISCFEPEGAFYLFPSIAKFGLSSDEFCTRLLTEGKVAVVPGSAFGDSGEGFVRISYAYSMKDLERALRRFEDFINRL